MIILKRKYIKVSLFVIILFSIISSQFASNYHHHTKKEICSVGCSCNINFNQSHNTAKLYGLFFEKDKQENKECYVCKSLELFQQYSNITYYYINILFFANIKNDFPLLHYCEILDEIKSIRSPPSI